MAQVVPHDAASDVDVVEDVSDDGSQFEGGMEMEDGPIGSDDEVDINHLIHKNFIIRDIERFVNHLDYAYLKQAMEWLLITARVGVSLSFEDTTMYMTLYVLFADNILFLSAPKSMGV